MATVLKRESRTFEFLNDSMSRRPVSHAIPNVDPKLEDACDALLGPLEAQCGDLAMVRTGSFAQAARAAATFEIEVGAAAIHDRRLRHHVPLPAEWEPLSATSGTPSSCSSSSSASASASGPGPGSGSSSPRSPATQSFVAESSQTVCSNTCLSHALLLRWTTSPFSVFRREHETPGMMKRCRQGLHACVGHTNKNCHKSNSGPKPCYLPSLPWGQSGAAPQRTRHRWGSTEAFIGETKQCIASCIRKSVRQKSLLHPPSYVSQRRKASGPLPGSRHLRHAQASECTCGRRVRAASSISSLSSD